MAGRLRSANRRERERERACRQDKLLLHWLRLQALLNTGLLREAIRACRPGCARPPLPFTK